MTKENNDKPVPRTAAATEARQQQAKKAKAEKQIMKRYGEFLPSSDVDPVMVYQQWKKSIFGEFYEEADDSIMYFVVAQAKAAGIDVRVPKQIYAIPYEVYNKATKSKEKKWTVITGIEGLVTIAENTGQYGGTTKPEYEFGILADSPEGFGQPDYNKIISCTIGVHKIVQGVPVTSYQTVFFDEYDTGKNLWKRADATKRKQVWKDGKPTEEYEDIRDGGKPKTMIKKVALAHALRATFSACAGLNIPEEVDHRDAIDGELVTPDAEEAVKNAKDFEDLQEILGGLSVEEKKRIAPLIANRMKELSQ